MRILVLSSTPWSANNSFGNSFSSIFEGMEDIEVANIACRPGWPDCYLVKRFYQMTEKSLLRNLKNKSYPAGEEHRLNSQKSNAVVVDNIKGWRFGQKKRWQILFWMRDLIWLVGRWKSPELDCFLDDFKPDLIFQPVYYSSYLNDIAQYIKKHTDVPMLGYISDDCYTLKQLSFSPLYWIDRLYKRRKVKKTIEMCELLYVISDIQKEEYEKCFTTKCKILTKGADFSKHPDVKEHDHNPLQLVYTGNIGTNRWKSLKMIANVLEKINQDGIKAQLRIYTATPLTTKMEKALNRGQSSFLMGSVPASEVPNIQKDADILVHVEALDLKSRLAVRHSLSTKIVDYLKAARPILAVGPKDVASMDHLIRNECAIVADHSKELEEKIRAILSDPAQLDAIVEKAYECGRKYHDRHTIQKMLKEDLEAVCRKK